MCRKAVSLLRRLRHFAPEIGTVHSRSMKYLVLTIRKPQFDASVVPAHYAFLQSLRDRGILEQAGPFTDRSGGAYVVTADNLEQARQLAERDPLHMHDCSEVTVREWDAS
jgi:uncharacterized protein YciI